MIVTRLMGGLGNQLFQYSIGRALAAHRRTELLLDTSWFDAPPPGTTPRSYELGAYRIRARPWGPLERWKFQGGQSIVALRHFLEKKYRHVREPNHWFDATLADRPEEHLYLDGYWQSERYFLPLRAELLRELTLTRPPTDADRRWLDEIAASPSVAVHIRRADYLENERLRAIHGVCSRAYYDAGFQHVRARVDTPHFFMFSDDPSWVRASFQGPDVRHVSTDAPERGSEDLRLMRACKHFVIANSSLSWWGAWLSEHHEKIVVAPHRWFADESANEGDLIPTSWVRK